MSEQPLGHSSRAEQRTRRRAAVPLRFAIPLGVIVVAVFTGLAAWWSGWRSAARTQWSATLTDTAPGPVDDRTGEQIRAFCGDCHALPRPDSFPRDQWHTEVRKGYDFYAQSGRTDLDPPPMYETVAWYRRQAPPVRSYPQPIDAPDPLTVGFRTQLIPAPAFAQQVSAVADLQWRIIQGGPEASPELLAMDMRGGIVSGVSFERRRPQVRRLARLKFPCSAVTGDVNQDGLPDLVVADLGSFSPADHDQGRVVLLEQLPQGQFQETTLASGLGRVADVKLVDVDGDKDQDVLVAEFGAHRTGSTIWLRNQSPSPGAYQFAPMLLDRRPGTSELRACELTGDGDVDFVALVSQEYEQLMMFINQRHAVDARTPFAARLLWEAPDLTYGLNGLELADLDGDGDQDIVFANGDAFDNFRLQPHHGIQWLKNDGEMRFTYHRIADMLGVCGLQIGDVDRDGDLDIVASAWMPDHAQPRSVFRERLPAVLCLEQTSPGSFARHTLAAEFPHNPALVLADLDGDHDLDIAAGSYLLDDSQRPPYWIKIWWNEGRR